MWHLSCVTGHESHVTCQVSDISCQVQFVSPKLFETYNKKVITKNVKQKNLQFWWSLLVGGLLLTGLTPYRFLQA